MSRHDGGKGDMKRPLVVPMAEFDRSWDAIFGKKEDKKPEFVVDIEADTDGQQITLTKVWEF
jgi:uncharacterized membrane protein